MTLASDCLSYGGLRKLLSRVRWPCQGIASLTMALASERLAYDGPRKRNSMPRYDGPRNLAIASLTMALASGRLAYDGPCNRLPHMHTMALASDCNDALTAIC